MNILFLSTRSPYPLISGHSLRTYHILKGAAEKHEVTLVTFVQLPEHELKDENLNHLRSFCKAVYPFPIPVDVSRSKLTMTVLLNLFSPLPFVAQKYDSPKMRSKIREILQREAIDLVHVDMLHLTVYLDEFRKLPRILINHNVESIRLYRWYQTEPNLLKKAFLGIQWLKLRSFERSALNSYSSCVVVSDTDKSLLTEMKVNSRLFVVPNGTDTEFFKPTGAIRAIPNSVVWIGHMDVHTNKDAVLYFWRDIVPLLREGDPAIQITFVGTAPPKEIEEAAKRDDRIRATGFVDDIRPYLEEAAVMVVPIRIGSGTRLKILDAMAMGKAIVSTSVGCEGLRVADARNILIADNPREFVDKTLRVITDGNVRRELEENATKLAKEYDWKHLCALQEQVYQQAVSGKSSPT